MKEDKHLEIINDTTEKDRVAKLDLYSSSLFSLIMFLAGIFMIFFVKKQDLYVPILFTQTYLFYTGMKSIENAIVNIDCSTKYRIYYGILGIITLSLSIISIYLKH